MYVYNTYSSFLFLSLYLAMYVCNTLYIVSDTHLCSVSLAGDKNPETYQVSRLSEEVLQMMEADSFWCMQKLLEGIQDNYTLAQPGIQTKIMALKDLIKRLDGEKVLEDLGGGGINPAIIITMTTILSITNPRLSRGSPDQQWGGVHPVCLPLDEQLANEGVPPSLCHTAVGLLPGEWHADKELPACPVSDCCISPLGNGQTPHWVETGWSRLTIALWGHTLDQYHTGLRQVGVD